MYRPSKGAVKKPTSLFAVYNLVWVILYWPMFICLSLYAGLVTGQHSSDIPWPSRSRNRTCCFWRRESIWAPAACYCELFDPTFHPACTRSALCHSNNMHVQSRLGTKKVAYTAQPRTSDNLARSAKLPTGLYIFSIWAKLSQDLMDRFSRSFHQMKGICVNFLSI